MYFNWFSLTTLFTIAECMDGSETETRKPDDVFTVGKVYDILTLSSSCVKVRYQI